MSATTRWKDDTDNDFANIIRRLESSIADDTPGRTYWINMSCRSVYENMQKIEINGRDIDFTAYTYKFDQVRKNNDDEDQIIQKNGLVILYEISGAVHYIVDQKTYASKLLRKLLHYNGRKELINENVEIPDDFFPWLVSRFFYKNDLRIDNTISISNTIKVLQLDQICGIKGDTGDLQTKVSTEGESVMDIISTQSFLIESNSLNQLVFSMSYTGHEYIKVRLKKKSLEYIDPYHGEYLDDESSPNEVISKLYLLLYLEIIPLILHEYYTDLKAGEWNKANYITFIEKLNDDVRSKAADRITYLRNH